MPFPYKKVLVVGATAGIGQGLADAILADGASVIAVGRRQERLDAWTAKHGGASGKASGMALDIGKLDDIPGFAKAVTTAHPDLDCVLLNAGTQNVMDMSKPSSVSISKIEEEMRINYISFVALTHAFMPFLLEAAHPTAIMYTTSGLMALPYPMVFNYCATKAALRSFILSLREQLKARQCKTKVVEIIPPLVQTELHDGQPGVTEDHNPGMPLDAFIKEAMEGLHAQQDSVPVGMAHMNYNKFEKEKEAAVGPAWAMIQKGLGPDMHRI